MINKLIRKINKKNEVPTLMITLPMDKNNINYESEPASHKWLHTTVQTALIPLWA